MTSPAVPGAINIVSLTGNEVVPIHPKGQGVARTTTGAIANLAGGGPTGPTGPAGATGATGATGPSGSGGGVAIQPETGPAIKISAISAAAGAGMGVDDIVTGLQGGANANFSQAQILTGAGDGATFAPTNLVIKGGFGGSSYIGGNAKLSGGYSTAQRGGNATVQAGDGIPGGEAALNGGYSPTGNAGRSGCQGGFAVVGAGGNSYLYGGNGGTKGGDILLTPGTGVIPGVMLWQNVTVAASNAGLASGTVWINSSTRVVSVVA